MRLLNVSLKSFLIYSLLLVMISIPVSFFTIQQIMEEEVDEALWGHRDQLVNHLRRSQFIGDPASDLKVYDRFEHDVEIEAGAAGKELFRTVTRYDSIEQEERPFRELVSYVTLNGKAYSITLRQSLLDYEDLVFSIITVQTALVLLLAIGLLIINRSLSRNLWKPFYVTLSKLKSFQLDKNQPFAPETSRIVEFNDLNQAIRQLTDRNREVFVQQKEFIENASHELQTPLAIFQSKLDVFAQSENLSESQAMVIKDLMDVLQRLVRLDKNLLLLSKIENDQFVGREPMDLVPIVSNSITNIKEIAESASIGVMTDFSPCVIDGNRTLIEIIVNNLLNNAFVHNMPRGKISVEVKERELSVSNTGLSALSEDKIFNRFSRDSTNVNGLGLGLAIVKKICDLSGYSVKYSFKENLHVFAVTFK